MHPKLRKNGKKCIPNASQMHPSENPESTQKNSSTGLSCEFCGKIFTKHQNYYRHKKYHCKKKGDLTRKELEIIIESRDQTIMELKNQIEKLLDKDLNQIKVEIDYSSCDDELCIFRNETFNVVFDNSIITTESDNVTLEDVRRYSALELDLDNNLLISLLFILNYQFATEELKISKII